MTAKSVERTAEAIGSDIAQREQEEIQRAVQLDLPIVVSEPIPILYVQMDGLISSNGILPAAGFVEAVKGALHTSRWWTAPTLAYFSASDAFLHALCIGGIVKHLTVPIAQDIRGKPAVQAQLPGFQSRSNNGFHERLAGLKILAADRYAAVGRQFQ